MRQDPVLPSDIKLIREVMGIMEGFDGFLGKEDHFDTGLDDFLICEDHSKYVKKILHSFFAEIKIKFVTSSYYVSENKEFE